MDVYHAGYEILTLESVPSGDAAELIRALVEVLCTIDAIYLRRYPHTPSLYRAGVSYRRQELGRDRWLDIPRLLQTRAGSCEDLVAWRVAELRAQGESARVLVEVHDIDPKTGQILRLTDGRPFVLYHIQVGRGSGVEDPSEILGMHAVPARLPLM